MRTADGLALLREIVREYGPVGISHVEGEEGEPWSVSLIGSFNHEHGASLEETVAALYDQLQRVGRQRHEPRASCPHEKEVVDYLAANGTRYLHCEQCKRPGIARAGEATIWAP